MLMAVPVAVFDVLKLTIICALKQVIKRSFQSAEIVA